MQEYVVVNGKKFRKGYTTGSCAAAAAKAAVCMLNSGNIPETVTIDTPAGVRLMLPVSDAIFLPGSAKCAVVKDGGDDPDMTTGLKIFAKARFIGREEIVVTAGEGIGTVTLPGLKVDVGKPAINPVPMKMIQKEVREVLGESKGVEITLSVPGGQEVAKKTFNPKLGIVNGISILGTSGIVTPMSEEAWKHSIELELKVAAASGFKTLVYTFGNIGENFAVNEAGIKKEQIIKVSNFIGYMLDKALEAGIEKILLIGHPGKLVKVSAGIFHTHSRVADARMEILACYTSLEGAPHEVVSKVYACRTTEGAAQVIKSQGITGVFDRIATNAAKRCSDYTFGKINVGCLLFSEDDTLLSMDKSAKVILSEMGSRLKK